MKKIALLVAIMVCIQSLSFAEPPKAPAQAPPMATFPDAGQWDFGKVNEGQTVKHEFEVKNKSGKTMKIISVNTSCGCTASQAKKQELAPGESTTVEVSFNSSGYSGWVQQYVFVTTDDLNNPMLRYIIRADVVAGKKERKKK